MKIEPKWRPIPGFEGYEISDQGRVRRLEPVLPGRDGTVYLRGPSGRSYRSVGKILREVWPDAVPEALQRSVRTKPVRTVQPAEDVEPSDAPPIKLSFRELNERMERERDGAR